MSHLHRRPKYFFTLLKGIAKAWVSILPSLLPLLIITALVSIAAPLTHYDPRELLSGDHLFLHILGHIIWAVVVIYLLTLLYHGGQLSLRKLPIDYRRLIKNSFSVLPRVIMIYLCFYAMVAIGTVCFVLPGIFLYIALAFAVPLSMIYTVRIKQAFQMSMALVNDNWWRCLGTYVVCLGAGGLITVILTFILPSMVAAFINHILMTSIIVTTTLMLLQDMRLRNPEALAELPGKRRHHRGGRGRGGNNQRSSHQRNRNNGNRSDS